MAIGAAGIGGAIVGAFTTGATIGAIGTIVATAINGALIGAAIGGLSAAVTGGSIGKGVLFGAVGGAVTGGLGAYLSPATNVGTTLGGQGVLANAPTYRYFMAPPVTAQGAFKAATGITLVAEKGASLGSTLAATAVPAGISTVGQMIAGSAAQDAAAEAADKAAEVSQRNTEANNALRERLEAANNSTALAQTGIQAAVAKRGQDITAKTARENLEEQIRVNKEASALEVARKERVAGAATGQQVQGVSGQLQGPSIHEQMVANDRGLYA